MTEKESSQILVCPVCGNVLQGSPNNVPKFCSNCGQRINPQTDFRKIRKSSYPDNYLFEDEDSLDIRDMEEVYGAPPWEEDPRLDMGEEYERSAMRPVYGAPPWEEDPRLDMGEEYERPAMRPVYGAPPHRRNIIARLIEWIICR